ncbi:MAG: CIA30 family protein [Phormidesmis sp.]
MKLALKIFSLLCMVAAIWWVGTAASAPQRSAADKSQQQEVSKSVKNESSVLIADFETPAEAERWRTVDDNVMGGISQGTFSVTPAGTGVFSGTLSLANNGGFSSVRRAAEGAELEAATAVSIRVKGDGRRYQLRLKMDPSDRAPSYRAEFETRAGEWTTVTLQLSDFEPVFRGRVLDDAPAIAPDQIAQIGFLIADKREGEFALEIDWIRAT